MAGVVCGSAPIEQPAFVAGTDGRCTWPAQPTPERPPTRPRRQREPWAVASRRASPEARRSSRCCWWGMPEGSCELCRGKIPSGMRGCEKRHDPAGVVRPCSSVARRAEKGGMAAGRALRSLVRRRVVGWRSRGAGRMMPTVAEQPPAGIQSRRRQARNSRTGAGAARS
jgi:hypothetical protein